MNARKLCRRRVAAETAVEVDANRCNNGMRLGYFANMRLRAVAVGRSREANHRGCPGVRYTHACPRTAVICH